MCVGFSSRQAPAAVETRRRGDIDIRQAFAYAPGMAITRRQRELYDFISRFVAENQYSPSFEEIKVGMGLSSLATVHKHVTNLEKKRTADAGLQSKPFHRSGAAEGEVETVHGGEYGDCAPATGSDCGGAAD
jgi:repressor LexA